MEPSAVLLGANEDYPSQDGIDRRDHIAFIVHYFLEVPEGSTPEDVSEIAAPFWEAREEFCEHLSRFVTEAVREAVDLELFPRPTAVHYQIGPAAGGLGNATDFIITLARGLNEIPPAFDMIANTWAVAEIARRLALKLRSWSRRSGLRADPSFPPSVLTALCEDHVRQVYHRRSELTSSWYCTSPEFYGGYVSPAHPTGQETYLVMVNAGRRTYCYAIDGRAKVNVHYVKTRKRIEPLAVPNVLQISA